jgi:hypothetical protein
MKALLMALLLGINFQCMKVKEKGVSECILAQIAAFEKGPADFGKVREAHGVAAGAQTEFQFTVKDSAGCGADVAFVKEGDGERVGGIYLTLSQATSVSELKAQFGEFKNLPATPAKKWSAIAKYNSGKLDYAIIAEAREKIDANTPIKKVTIRIDYPD